MTKNLSAAFFLLSTSPLIAQENTTTNALGQSVTVVAPSSFGLSAPARDWPEAEDKEIPFAEQRETKNHREWQTALNANALPQGIDPILQTAGASRSTAPTLVNFGGQSGSGFPPDPSGAAGPDHYVQAINTKYRVYSKTGSALSPSMDLNTLWPGTDNEGDPIVMYDRHADRWFISQFNSGPSRMLLAVSETGDPLGSYYTYSYTFSQFPDYPKFSIWWDGYYMTSNSNRTAVVFDRAKMLNGDPSAQMIALTAPSAGTYGFRSILPADADGDLPPAGTPCYFFNLEDDAWSGVTQDRIKIYAMTVDWVNTGNTTVVTSQTLPTAPFNTNFGNSINNIAQPGTTQKLDAVFGVFYYRAQHMRFLNHNSIVLSHVVDVDNTDHAGIRWYELRDQNDGVWAIHQSGTYAPDVAHRWMASMAMDVDGNIGLGYCVSDPVNGAFPGLRYTGRMSYDTPGEMTFTEEVAQAGGSAQQNINRYGDYSHMSLDPNGTTFWFTGEYMGTFNQPRTKVFSFDLSDFTAVDELSSSRNGSLSVAQQNDVLNVALTGLAKDLDLQVDLITLEGRTVSTRRVHTTAGSWNGQLDISALAPAVYFVRLANADYQKAQRVIITR